MKKKFCMIAAMLTAFFMFPFISYSVLADDFDEPELSGVPPGTGTVIEYDTDPDGKLFYTVMTADGHVFYLVIDKNSSMNNVYFLNAVTIADLAALAEISLPAHSSMIATPALPPTTASEPPEQSVETTPPLTSKQPQNGGNMGMYIIIGILVIIGGGAGWYFKIYRPKQQDAADGDEYDPSMDESENDYASIWEDGGGESEGGE